jgi:peptidoglycan/xylan/chitin deacetylase (PgdA/CDA1 family)
MAKGRRERAAEAITAIGGSRLLVAARGRARPGWLTIINYHRVNEPAAVAGLDEGVLDATPEAFDRQMAMVRARFSPVSLEELLAHLDGRPLPRSPLLVTFDDGYLDNLEIAVPILQRHGIRAAFFIATDYVHCRKLFWWDRLSWTVKHAARRRFTLRPAQAPVEIDLDAGVAAAERKLQTVVKRTPGLDLAGFLSRLSEASEAPWSDAVEAALAARHVMTWDHVRALRAAGMQVGAHTRTHRALETVPVHELPSELRGAREDLESQIGEPVHAIAYPVGRPVAGISSVRSAIEAAGYRLGFSYRTGLQSMADLDPFDVHRLSVDGGQSAEFLLARIALPALFP